MWAKYFSYVFVKALVKIFFIAMALDATYNHVTHISSEITWKGQKVKPNGKKSRLFSCNINIITDSMGISVMQLTMCIQRVCIKRKKIHRKIYTFTQIPVDKAAWA